MKIVQSVRTLPLRSGSLSLLKYELSTEGEVLDSPSNGAPRQSPIRAPTKQPRNLPATTSTASTIAILEIKGIFQPLTDESTSYPALKVYTILKVLLPQFPFFSLLYLALYQMDYSQKQITKLLHTLTLKVKNLMASKHTTLGGSGSSGSSSINGRGNGSNNGSNNKHQFLHQQKGYTAAVRLSFTWKIYQFTYLAAFPFVEG